MLPQFSEKHNQPSLITPEKVMEHRRQYGRYPTTPPPKTVIFCYQSRFFTQILEEMAHRRCDGCFSKFYYLTDHPSVAIGDIGIGAPQAATKMEELISWGVKQFISIGTAGSLQKKVGVGDVVLCDQAIRDEGTSFHYIPPSKYIHAPRRMTNKLQQLLKASQVPYHIGCSWTTDSFYRQTLEEIDHYQKEGVLSVEMEASALFAVAHYHKVDLGAMFTITDTHADLDWKPHFEDTRPRNNLRQILNIAIQAASEDEPT